MKSLLFLFLVFCAELSFGQTSGKITGEVSENATNQLLSGAKITLYNNKGVVMKRAMSNSQGIYEMTDVTYGDYSITFKMMGFDSMVQEIQVSKPIINRKLIIC